MYAPLEKKKTLLFWFELFYMYHMYVYFLPLVLMYCTKYLYVYTPVLHYYIRIGIDISPEMYMYVMYTHYCTCHTHM